MTDRDERLDRSGLDDVDREALHDWLDERPDLDDSETWTQ